MPDEYGGIKTASFIPTLREHWFQSSLWVQSALQLHEFCLILCLLLCSRDVNPQNIPLVTILSTNFHVLDWLWKDSNYNNFFVPLTEYLDIFVSLF